MADSVRVICDSGSLRDGGKGVRFRMPAAGGEQPAFAVRHNGKVYAYINRCAHVPVELDWTDGDFFDYSKLYLICATHGAMYLPDSGLCIQGPCPGKRLQPVSVEERDGQILLLKESHHV
jgi:nitrite reductase/ring-hydroxylating ferredoxin subunit